jgi:CxxC motif-containing protein (DUF1111 family)
MNRSLKHHLCSRFLARLALLLAAPLALHGCGDDEAQADPLAGLTLVPPDLSDGPIPGLDPAWQRRFDEGDGLFEQSLRPSQGLGPLYIRDACAGCHAGDARGPGSVRKAVLVGSDGAPLDDQGEFPFGPTERPRTAAGATQGIEVPNAPHALVTVRQPPAVFGRGYIEAVREDEVERQAALQAQRDDGIRGRVPRVVFASRPNPDTEFHALQEGQETLGRFGLKARQPTLDDFTADAYQGDMGITSPMRPDELPNPDDLDDDLRPGVDLDLDVVNRVADYMRLLDIPKRPAPDPRAQALFEQTRCAVCHVPALQTRDDYPIPQFAGIAAPIYSDMLLHDMGEDLADGLTDQQAGPRDWRTAPLMGLRHLTTYLHDGRARTVEDAVLMHRGPGSEANDSIERFEALSDADRALLLDFVKGL